MELKEDVVILGAKRRDMTFDDGRSLRDTVVATVDTVIGENEKGLRFAEIKGPFNVFDKLTELPGKYECSFNWDGKKMTLLDANYKEAIQFEI